MESLKSLYCEATVSDNIVASVILDSNIDKEGLKFSRSIRTIQPRKTTRIHCHTRPCSKLLSIFCTVSFQKRDIICIFCENDSLCVSNLLSFFIGIPAFARKNVVDAII